MFKILVVEDDKDLNRSVCTFLKQNGYDAVGCPGANKAYDAMYDTVFDLIISDIMMPGVDEMILDLCRKAMESGSMII